MHRYMVKTNGGITCSETPQPPHILVQKGPSGECNKRLVESEAWWDSDDPQNLIPQGKSHTQTQSRTGGITITAT